MENWFYTIPATQVFGKKEIKTVQKVWFNLFNTEVFSQNISLLAQDTDFESKDSQGLYKLVQLLIFVHFVKFPAMYLSVIFSEFWMPEFY